MEKIIYDVIINGKSLKNHSVEAFYILDFDTVKSKEVFYKGHLIKYGFNKEQRSWFVIVDDNYYKITNDNCYTHAINIVNKLIKNKIIKYYSYRNVFNRNVRFEKTYFAKNFKYAFDLYFVNKYHKEAMYVGMFDGNIITMHPSPIYNFLWDNFKEYCL